MVKIKIVNVFGMDLILGFLKYRIFNLFVNLKKIIEGLVYVRYFGRNSEFNIELGR